MVEIYWQIGHKIVEEQNGKQFSKYEKGLLKSISERLQNGFGKGFTYATFWWLGDGATF
ncbi:MAG: DUF1016 N-terminal domain-containing protein [Chitinophagales bacterium]|nr:DUF1016 N-terminal domain-containing protein [Chitinophagales bacterium]